MRQGRKFQIVGTYRGIDTEMTAQHVIEFREQHNVDAVIVDDDGISGAVTDHLRARGFGDKLFPFDGAAEPADRQMYYYNKRAECWGLMRDWLKAGAEIPDDALLDRQLTSAKYFVARGMSRWTMPSAWAASSPSATWMLKSRMVSISIGRPPI